MNWKLLLLAGGCLLAGTLLAVLVGHKPPPLAPLVKTTGSLHEGPLESWEARQARKKAALALPMDEATAKRLVELLLQEHDEEFAEDRLRAAGARVLPVLLAALKDPRFRQTRYDKNDYRSPYTRLTGLLEELSPPAAVPDLVAHLQDPQERVRRAAGNVLASIASDAALPALQQVLAGKDHAAVERVLDGLHTAMNDGRGSAALRTAMFDAVLATHDRPGKGHNQAPRVLVLLDRERGVTALSAPQRLRAGHPQLERMLAVLNEVEAPLPEAQLLALLTATDAKRDTASYGAVLQALARQQCPQAEARCRQALGHKENEVRVAAAEGLCRLQGVRDPYGVVNAQREWRGALSLSPPQRVWSLLDGLQDEDEGVGSVSDLLYYPADELARYLAAFKIVGADPAHTALTKAMALIEFDKLPKDEDKRYDEISARCKRHAKALEALDPNSKAIAELPVKLWLYVLAHPADFGGVPLPLTAADLDPAAQQRRPAVPVDDDGIKQVVDQLLNPPDDDVKERLRAAGQRAVPALLATLKDERFLKTKYVGAYGQGSPLAEVVRLLVAAEATQAVPALLPLAKHRDRDVREAALYGLGRFATDACRPALTEALADTKYDSLAPAVLAGLADTLMSGRKLSAPLAGALYLHVLGALDNGKVELPLAPRVLLRLDREQAVASLTEPSRLTTKNHNLLWVLVTLGESDVSIPATPLLELTRTLHPHFNSRNNDERAYGEVLLALARYPEQAVTLEPLCRAAMQHPESPSSIAAAHALCQVRGLVAVWTPPRAPSSAQRTQQVLNWYRDEENDATRLDFAPSSVHHFLHEWWYDQSPADYDATVVALRGMGAPRAAELWQALATVTAEDRVTHSPPTDSRFRAVAAVACYARHPVEFTAVRVNCQLDPEHVGLKLWQHRLAHAEDFHAPPPQKK